MSLYDLRALQFYPRRIMLVATVWLTFMAAACEPTQSHNGAATREMSHVGLVDHLRAKGLDVKVIDRIDQPFLSVSGTLLALSGDGIEDAQTIQSFEYETAKACQKDAATIGRDGTPTGTHVTWTATPHFFKSGRVLVLYIGDDPGALQILTAALGDQFAGH